MKHSLHERNRLGIYLPLFILGTLSAVILRTVAFFSDLDVSTGYFGEKALITVSDSVAAAFCLILLLHAFSHMRKDSTPKIRFDNAATYVPLGGLTAAVFLLSLNMAIKVINEGAEMQTVPLVIRAACCILGFLSVVTFVMDLIIERPESVLRGAFTLCTVMFFALYSVSVYFSDGMAENSQQKLLTELGFIFAAAFFLYEARISIGTQKWHSHAAFGASSALLLAYASFPNLILFSVRGGALLANDVYELAAMGTAAIFIGARTLLIAFCPEDETCDLAEAITDMEYEKKKAREQAEAAGQEESKPCDEASDAARDSNVMVENGDEILTDKGAENDKNKS